MFYQHFIEFLFLLSGFGLKMNSLSSLDVLEIDNQKLS